MVIEDEVQTVDFDLLVATLPFKGELADLGRNGLGTFLRETVVEKSEVVDLHIVDIEGE